MCGICGFNWEDKRILKEMTDSLIHRGPDQLGYYTDSSVSLGHRRLSIIDLSEKGKQPMSNENGDMWVVYNGEIYNFPEIRKDLENKGHVFKSNTDTEVIIHAYEEYDKKCADLFNGMFAFAIWDSKKKKILLFRDRLGVKPLFYYFDKRDNKLIFASEIKSIILNPLVKKSFNFSGVNQLIYYGYTVNGETLIEGIYELLPGHLLTYDFNDINIERFWDLKRNINYANESFFSKKLKILLNESVKKRLVADVPIGASLSGGIDSSCVVAFASKLVDKPLKTFTVGFNDESDEFNEAKRTAEFFNTDHHEIRVDFKEVSENLPKILWHAETAFSKPAMFATYFLSRGINESKVIIDLSGEGSDEIFGGYNRYDCYLYKNLQQSSNIDRAKKVVSGNFNSDEDKRNFFKDSFLKNMKDELKPENKFIKYLEAVDKTEYLNAALEFELKNQLPGVQLWRADRMSMANSHEIRVPFLDYHLVEFGMTIPSDLKWNVENKKYILQKAMEDVLPKDNITRKKLPFHMPLAKYFQKDFTEVSHNILAKSSILNKEFIIKNSILNNIKKLKSGENLDDNSLRQILFFVNLEMFNKLFLEADKITRKDLSINNFI